MGEPVWPAFRRLRQTQPPAVAGKWHLDEIVVAISGVKVWFWRAVDANGDVLDILGQPRRNAKAARRFLTSYGPDQTVFRPRRYRLSATSCRNARSDAFDIWNGDPLEMTV